MRESKPLRKEFMLAMGRKGFPQKDMDAAMARLRRTYERMDAEIEKSGGPWLLGSDISLADIMVMPAIVRMADLGRDARLAGSAARPALVRRHSRLSGLRADLLSGLAAHGALPAFAQSRHQRDQADSGSAVCTTSPRARASATPSARSATSASD